MQLIAHRGGVVDKHLYAENSRQGLAEASKRGYHGVELDVRLTSDGHLIVHHDRHFGPDWRSRMRMPFSPETKASQLVET